MNDSQAESVGLVLQGGGALGAFEVGVIEYLLETAREPLIVSGVSIGAVNATAFCGSRNPDRLRTITELWEELTTFDIPFVPPEIDKCLSMFGNPGMYRPRLDVFNFLQWTSFSDTSPLRDTLNRYVAFDELRPEITSRPQLILAATNVETGAIDSFDSQLMAIEPDHVLASGALPPGFPAITVRDQNGRLSTYWDGGLYNNTPLSQVIHALERIKRRVKTMVVVNLFPKQNRIPKNIREVIDRSFEIVFGNKTSTDIERARQTRQLIALGEQLKNIIDTLPDAQRKRFAALEKDEGYRVLQDWKPVFDRLVEIENTEDEPMDAATDFTRETIQRRRQAGYRQAIKAFKREEVYGL